MSHRTLVVTVTPNPSLDLLFEGEHLVWDDANRTADPRRRPGGQGINAARAVHALGGSAVAVALIAGQTGDEIVTALQQDGTAVRTVAATGETRTFVAARDHSAGRSMLLNARGPARTPADQDALMRVVVEELRDRTPHWLACCGSLPHGFEPTFYRDLALEARRLGVSVVVDCDGEALGASAGLCDLLVPNQHEAERLIGRTIQSESDAISALQSLPAPLAAITLGAEGAILRAGSDIWRARAPRLSGSTVGAGDCFLAGLLHAFQRGAGPGEALAHAVGAASAALMSRGSDLVRRSDAEAIVAGVKVERVG